MLEVGEKFAWRKGSAQTLKVGQIDFFSNTIRLEPDQTKNDEAVVAVMRQVRRELLTVCCADKGPDDFVFTYSDERLVKDYCRAWKRAIKAPGLTDFILHDLCRAGIRNMRRRIDKDVAMKVSGRKTDSIIQRYNIIDENDIADAALKMDKQLPGQQASQLGHSLDIVQSVKEAVQNNFKAQVIIAK
jgi:integrase